MPLPDDPGIEARLEVVREKLAEAKALLDTGKYRQGLRVAQAAESEARATGYAPVSGEALWLLGHLQEAMLDQANARRSLTDGAWMAIRGQADALAAHAAAAVVRLSAGASPPGEGSDTWAELASALLGRRGGNEEIEGVLADALGVVRARQGRRAEGRELLERARLLRARALGPDHPDLAHSLTNLGSALWALGKDAEAIAVSVKALETLERALGPGHPRLLEALWGLSTSLQVGGRAGDAIPYLRRGIAIAEAVFGPEHLRFVQALVNLCGAVRESGEAEDALLYCRRALGIVERHPAQIRPRAVVHTTIGLTLSALGRPEALHYLRRAAELFEQAFGPNHPFLPLAVSHVGLELERQGRIDEAIAHHRRALAVRQGQAGLSDRSVASMTTSLADALRAKGRLALARDSYERGCHLFEKTLGRDHHHLARPLTGLGLVLLAQGKAADAVRVLERALAVVQGAQGRDAEKGEARFALARALWRTPAARPRARSLAQEARPHFQRVPWYRREVLPKVEAWLARHQAAPSP
jgi:tetratricopeptide (TPR) repeat protein